MKTIKIFLRVAGLALTTICFGQLLSHNNFEAPIMIRTFFVPMESDMHVESWMTAPYETNVYEEVPEIESWMTTAWIWHP